MSKKLNDYEVSLSIKDGVLMGLNHIRTPKGEDLTDIAKDSIKVEFNCKGVVMLTFSVFIDPKNIVFEEE